MQLGQIGALDLARDAPGGMIVIDVRGRVAGVQHIESNILAGDQVGGVGFAQNLLEELQRIFTIYSLEGFRAGSKVNANRWIITSRTVPFGCFYSLRLLPQGAAPR